MATGSSGASEIENEHDLHADLQVKLARMLVTEDVQELKHVLKTAKILAPRQLEKCETFYDVWSRLEKVGRLDVNKYDVLGKYLGILEYNDCVRVIDAYKKRIDECRTEQKGLEQQLDELTIDGADDHQHTSETPIGEPASGSVPETTASVVEKCSQFLSSTKKKIAEPTGGAVPETTRGESFVKAARNGDAAAVHKLLSEGADVDYERSSDGWTALMTASFNGHIDIVDALLKGGAEVNKEEKSGATALFMASQNGHLDVVDALLKGEADVNKEKKGRWTPLMIASQNGHRDVVDALLKGGAEVDKEAENGYTALMKASQQGHLDVVDALLKKGAATDKTSKAHGVTALMIASKNGHHDVVDALLKEGAAIDKTTKDGRWTALKLAEAKGHTKVIELLKKSGAKR